MEEVFVVGVLMIVLGLLFWFYNRGMGDWTFRFYKKIYTERNLVVMFRVGGLILVFGGLVLMVLKYLNDIFLIF